MPDINKASACVDRHILRCETSLVIDCSGGFW